MPSILCVCVCVHTLSCVQHFVTPWTVALQAPLSMEFSRQEYWSGFPFPSPWGSSWPKDRTCVSCIDGSFTSWATREATKHSIAILFYCLLSHSVFLKCCCNSLNLFHIPLIDYSPQFENHWSNPTCLFKHIVYSSSLVIYSSTLKCSLNVHYSNKTAHTNISSSSILISWYMLTY